MEKKIFALGFFDGVHLGHQALLLECVRLATARSCRAAAMTFDLPPGAILRGLQPNMINTPRDRELLLRQYGMDTVSVYPATEQTLSMSWQDFLRTLLESGAEGFVCGEDYRFGHNGEGTAEKLAAFCDDRDLPCVIVPEQKMDDEKISSSRIRALLEKGDVENAGRLLGHPHILTGTVVAGQRLGRTIGVPTANLLLPEELVRPAFGVYACLATVENRKFVAVTNIGTRPTVDGQNVTVEPWILDFDGDLYGQEISLQFHKFLRPEQKFADLESLKTQIHQDAAQAFKLLK